MQRSEGKAAKIIYVHRSKAASDEQVVFYIKSALDYIKLPDNVSEFRGNTGNFYRDSCYITPWNFYFLEDELDDEKSRVVMDSACLNTRDGDPENTDLHDLYPEHFASWIIAICDPLRDPQEGTVRSLPSYRVELLYDKLTNWWKHASGDEMLEFADGWGAARERVQRGSRHVAWSWATDMPYWTWIAIEEWLQDYCDYPVLRPLTRPNFNP